MSDVVLYSLMGIIALLVIIALCYLLLSIFPNLIKRLKVFYRKTKAQIWLCAIFFSVFGGLKTMSLADKFNNDNLMILSLIIFFMPFVLILLYILYYIIDLPLGIKTKIFSRHKILGYYHSNEKEMQNNQYTNFILENLYKIELFVRPSDKWDKITLANKILTLEIDIKSFMYNYCTLTIVDKINRKERTIEFHPQPRYCENKFALFQKLCGEFNYETSAEDVRTALKLVGTSKYRVDIKHSAIIEELCLDINEASEAELTALPGVTIAKAKRAIKLRKEKTRFSSVKEFYKKINLDEKFLEQIDFDGNDVILNELPLYKQIPKFEA